MDKKIIFWKFKSRAITDLVKKREFNGAIKIFEEFLPIFLKCQEGEKYKFLLLYTQCLVQGTQYNETLKYSSEILDYAIKSKNNKMEGEILFLTAMIYYYQANYSKANEKYNYAIKVFENLGEEYKEFHAKCYFYLGDIIVKTSDDNPDEYFNQAEKLARISLNDIELDFFLHHISERRRLQSQENFNKYLSDTTKLLDKIQKRIDICKQSEKTILVEHYEEIYFDVASKYGEILGNKGLLKKAESILHLSIERYDKLKKDHFKIEVMQTLAGIYLKEKKFEDSLSTFNETFKYYDSKGMKHPAAHALWGLGTCHKNLENYQEALTLFAKSMEYYFKMINNSKDLNFEFIEIVLKEISKSIKELWEIFVNHERMITSKNLLPIIELILHTHSRVIEKTNIKELPDEINKTLEEIDKMKGELIELLKNQELEPLIKQLLSKEIIYLGEKLDRIKIETFLNNIPNERIRLKKSLLLLLNQICYNYSIEEIINKIENRINAILQSDAKLVYLLIFDNEWDKSQPLISKLTEYYSKKSSRTFKLIKIGHLKKKIPEIDFNKTQFIIIDDLIGTGKQISKFFNGELRLGQFNESNIKKLMDNLFIVSCLGTESSKKYISNKIGLDETHISYDSLIREEEKAFHESNWVNSLDYRDEILEFLEVLDQKHFKGYGNEDDGLQTPPELLVVFQHTVPNSTISCLWKEVRKDDMIWKPLFPRY